MQIRFESHWCLRECKQNGLLRRNDIVIGLVKMLGHPTDPILQMFLDNDSLYNAKKMYFCYWKY